MDAAPAARIPRCQFPSGRSIFSRPSTVAGGDQRDVRVDEKGRGQPEVGGAGLLTDSDPVGVGMMGHPLATAAHRGPPRPRVGHRPHTGLHPEPSVVHPVGIGDHGERQCGLIALQLFGSKVEDHHLGDTRRRDVAVPRGEHVQVLAADRAVRKPAELQARVTRAGYCDHRSVQGGERGRIDDLARCQPA